MMPRHIRPLLLALLATLALPAAVAEAQYRRVHVRPASQTTVVIYPRGWYMGVGLVGTRILRQDGGAELLEHGGGFNLYTGLRVNRSLAIELGWMGTLHNPVAVDTVFGPDTDYLVLHGFTADAKVYFSTQDPDLEPYVQAGLGAYLLDSEYFGAQSAGTGLQVGAGLDYRVSPNLLLGLRGLYRGMAMGPPAATYSDTFVSALTFEANLGLRF